MDTKKINEELNRRFAEPLPEFYKRRIIVWHDDDKEFEDKLEEIKLENAKMLVLNGSNFFQAKKLLGIDDTDSNYLLYVPLSFESLEDNWLLDIELYSEEFRSDLISIWVDEMGLPSTPIIRNQVKNYRKFFRAKERREAVKKLSHSVSSPSHLHLAVMSVLCGNSDIDPGRILKAVVSAGLETTDNSIYQSFVAYGADKAFRALVEQLTGYSRDEEMDIGRLMNHILLTASTRTIHRDHLAGLDRFISIPHQAFCYDFVSDWIQSSDNLKLYEIAEFVEEEMRLPQRFSQLAVEDIADTRVFPWIDECILIMLMKEINRWCVLELVP